MCRIGMVFGTEFFEFYVDYEKENSENNEYVFPPSGVSISPKLVAIHNTTLDH